MAAFLRRSQEYSEHLEMDLALINVMQERYTFHKSPVENYVKEKYQMR